jgi:hypothetical protein
MQCPIGSTFIGALELIAEGDPDLIRPDTYQKIQTHLRECEECQLFTYGTRVKHSRAAKAAA